MSLLLFTDLSGRNITEQTLKDTGILPLLSAVLNEKEKVAVEEYLRKSPTYREIQKRPAVLRCARGRSVRNSSPPIGRRKPYENF